MCFLKKSEKLKTPRSGESKSIESHAGDNWFMARDQG